MRLSSHTHFQYTDAAPTVPVALRDRALAAMSRVIAYSPSGIRPSALVRRPMP